MSRSTKTDPVAEPTEDPGTCMLCDGPLDEMEAAERITKLCKACYDDLDTPASRDAEED